MNELITISYDTEQKPYVMGRDLHEKLEIRSNYRDWFPRMCEYGFVEGRDFRSFLSENGERGRPSTDHQVSIDMAKEICMLQRTELGKKYREYFLELEKQWNSPEAVMARALSMAQATLARITRQNTVLVAENQEQKKLIAEMAPQSEYYKKVLRCKKSIPITIIAKDYGMSAKRMNKLLHDLGIQFKKNKDTWLLYQRYADKGYTKSNTYSNKHGAFIHTYWTQLGREFIYNTLKKEKILPVLDETGVDPTGDEDINTPDIFGEDDLIW